ncbi:MULTISPECIES: SDR family NAD(P)-dependent oxidoreductase [Pseudonocardia]|uniref:SDR family NAD(P)-dependent oxidoreductase n=1 Tax=Pseudonocardia TaxID=1847 RepID=UPI00091AA52F|nr:SDR family NAD(P)-dependent oxidoreductase [Pseudonocardia sp. SID8383]MYW73293.1 SDR family oxidoreductase [Pseudonocardia sp. SID8383]OJG04905.1 Cyclopentanol dehydrogenase [Pseudonocardia autotrophica]
MTERRFEGSTVLLTGATGGLGAAVAERLVGEGAEVVLTDVDEAGCVALAGRLGGRTRTAALDVSSESDWERVVAGAGPLTGLVNNAGIGSLGTVVGESRTRWDEVVAVDQLGTWLGMRHCGPVIERSGGGSIVNVGSILGTTGGLGNSFAYAAAKGAVRSMTRNAALHWAGAGVRVNAVVPGFVGTDQLLGRFAGTDRHRAMLANTPMGRLGRPEEVAAAVAFLLSRESGYTTGSELVVDGGWSAR